MKANKNKEYEKVDALLREICKRDRENPIVYLANPAQIKYMKCAKDFLNASVFGIDVQIKESHDALYWSIGYLDISGKGIVVTDPYYFSLALKLSSCFSVETHTDGTVTVGLGFSNLAEGIGRLYD